MWFGRNHSAGQLCTLLSQLTLISLSAAHQLSTATVHAYPPPMRDVVIVLKKKIMNYVKAQAEQEAAAEDVVM